MGFLQSGQRGIDKFVGIDAAPLPAEDLPGGEPVFERVFVAGSVILSASAMAEKRDFALDGVSEGDLGLCEQLPFFSETRRVEGD